MDPVLFPNDTSFWFETLRVSAHRVRRSRHRRGADRLRRSRPATTTAGTTSGTTADRVAAEARRRTPPVISSAPATA